jgi:hypothetical protein
VDKNVPSNGRIFGTQQREVLRTHTHPHEKYLAISRNQNLQQKGDKGERIQYGITKRILDPPPVSGVFLQPPFQKLMATK